tara:strand:+ start:3074 stop:3433 length:360 start_codon:yes stop_codon:yes gene_type:complete
MANFRQQRDYVIGLITGRTKKMVNSEGRVQEVFVPNIINKHMPLSSMFAQCPDKVKEEILAEEGLVSNKVSINKDVFAKSPREKRYLKKMIADYKADLAKTGHTPRSKMRNAKVIILQG